MDIRVSERWEPSLLAAQPDGPVPYKAGRPAALSPGSRPAPYAPAYPGRFVQQAAYVPFYSVRTTPERPPPPAQPPQAPPPQPPPPSQQTPRQAPAPQPQPPQQQAQPQQPPQQPPQPTPPQQQPQQQQQPPPQQPPPQPPIEYLSTPPQARNRISLLHPQDFLRTLPQGARLQPPTDQVREAMPLVASAPTVHYDVGPPYKRMRLGEAKPDVQQPLRIDTREQQSQAYTPQVEAISPTLPSDSLQEETTFRSTKDELLQQIGKVDREIAKAESQIHKLKKKQQELEEAANKPAIKEEEEEIAMPKHQSQPQKIYAENRKKAVEAHTLLEKLGPKIDLPLYNQPSDTAVYHENKRRYLLLKKRLVEHFRRQHAERESREKFLTATYSKLMQEWLRKVEKVEASQKRKARDAKNRDFFEKVFPELRKQREDRERFNRVGARIKSEADLEEIMDSLQEQEMEDKKMRSYAVIPPILLDARQRRITFSNDNGRIEDFTAEYKERQLLNVWTDSEREIFKEKYLQHPKNFGLIASYLERKSVCDCVQYYYLSKKTENYKQLLRKSRQRTRASRNNPHGKVGNSGGSGAGNNAQSLADVPGGVTTRLQREQQQQKQEMAAPPPSSPPAAPVPPASPAPSTPMPLPPPSVASTPSDVKDGQSTPAPSPAAEKDQVTSDKDKASGDGKLENKKKERRKEDRKKKEDDESSDEECTDSQVLCMVAGIFF